MTDPEEVSDGGGAPVCPNCGSPAPDRYCPRCGQKQAARLVSTRRLLGDLLEDSFSLEARLPRTLAHLLFLPGRITSEYTRGRIARYVHPLRLYVVSSLLFFLVLSLVLDFDRIWGAIGPRAEAAPEDRYVLVNSTIDLARVPGPLVPAARAWLRHEDELNRMERREGVRVLYDATTGAVPPIVFLLVPFFALVLKGLYRRRLYVEHTVFVLHVHAFAFLLAAVALVAGSPWILGALLLWLAAWLYLAMRRVYGGEEPAWRTLLKYGALVVVYVFALGFTVIAVMIAAVMSV